LNAWIYRAAVTLGSLNSRRRRISGCCWNELLIHLKERYN
jgi:hypothetical protein